MTPKIKRKTKPLQQKVQRFQRIVQAYQEYSKSQFQFLKFVGKSIFEMAKKQEKKIAYEMYVILQKSAKEIHEVTGVSEKTLSLWINANNGAWKKERAARAASPLKRIANLEKIISDEAERRIIKSNELRKAEEKGDLELASDLKKDISRIDDAVGKWNKALETINKESKFSLSTYLEVMDTIFQALQAYSPNLFMQTIDFQEKHIHDACLKLTV